jgi:hypothetical protein
MFATIAINPTASAPQAIRASGAPASQPQFLGEDVAAGRVTPRICSEIPRDTCANDASAGSGWRLAVRRCGRDRFADALQFVRGGASRGIAINTCANPRRPFQHVLKPTTAWTPDIAVIADLVSDHVATVTFTYRWRRPNATHASGGPAVVRTITTQALPSNVLGRTGPRPHLRTVVLARPQAFQVLHITAWDARGNVVDTCATLKPAKRTKLVGYRC